MAAIYHQEWSRFAAKLTLCVVSLSPTVKISAGTSTNVRRTAQLVVEPTDRIVSFNRSRSRRRRDRPAASHEHRRCRSAIAIGPVEAYWRFRSWTVPITILIGLLAGLVVLATSGTSTASTTLYLTDPRGTPVFRDGSSTPTDLTRYARQRAEFADSELVRQQVVDNEIAARRSSSPAEPAR